MTQQYEIEKLASQILYYKKLYYSGKSVISDTEYDAIEDKLRNLSPDHPALSVVGYNIADNAKNKIIHHIPMLSLAKTYDQKDLLDFLNKHTCVAVDKVDGMALSLEYNSKGNLVVASTRGDGKFGENITEHVFHILSIPKKIHLDQNLPKDMHFEVRGEVYFPQSKFKNYADKFDSFRNAVPGTLGRKEVDEVIDILNCFEFYPYDLLAFQGQENLDSIQFNNIFDVDFDYLKKIQLIHLFGFQFSSAPLHEIRQPIGESELAKFIQEIYTRERDYQIDGIVFRVRNETSWERLGNTSHHPKGSLAFKQAGETAETEILAIEENVGRSGKITFRAKLKPVFLSGATISYATLHNAEYIEQGNYSVGAKVKIIRSGEVIPAIIDLIEPGPNKYMLPKHCKCGYELTRQGPDLMCLEKRTCNYKDQESLVYFVSSLDIMGVSDKIVFKLREAGLLNEPADLYKITVEDLLQIEGFAQKSSENIVASIQKAKELPLAKFLTALGLKRGGAVKCQEVARKCVTLENVLKLKTEELLEEKGWADKSAEDFVSSLQDKYPIINNLLKYVKVLDDTSANEMLKHASHPYYGKSICITGALSKPREEYKYLLEKVGAKLVSSVTSKTDFLVCNEASSSSKYKEAQKLSIPVIKEEELIHNL